MKLSVYFIIYLTSNIQSCRRKAQGARRMELNEHQGPEVGGQYPILIIIILIIILITSVDALVHMQFFMIKNFRHH